MCPLQSREGAQARGLALLSGELGHRRNTEDGYLWVVRLQLETVADEPLAAFRASGHEDAQSVVLARCDCFELGAEIFAAIVDAEDLELVVGVANASDIEELVRKLVQSGFFFRSSELCRESQVRRVLAEKWIDLEGLTSIRSRSATLIGKLRSSALPSTRT